MSKLILHLRLTNRQSKRLKKYLVQPPHDLYLWQWKPTALAKKLSQYMKTEGEQIPTGQTLLGTSDIIESIFSKYKYLSSECPLRDMGKMILTMPVLTTELTCELVKTAMESVQALDVEK